VGALRRWGSLLAPVVCLVGCDHVTKRAAKAELEHHAPLKLLARVLDLRYVENTDVGFNLLRWIRQDVRRTLLLVSGALALVVLVAVLGRRKNTLATKVALVLMLAGALGNYLDRSFRGYVVDFIHVPHWPVFNVADIYVTAGAVLLAWSSLRNSTRRNPV
jgi:signal peptidase II